MRVLLELSFYEGDAASRHAGGTGLLLLQYEAPVPSRGLPRYTRFGGTCCFDACRFPNMRSVLSHTQAPGLNLFGRPAQRSTNLAIWRRCQNSAGLSERPFL